MARTSRRAWRWAEIDEPLDRFAAEYGTVRLADMAERSFARHETFHPRYGWFRKAYAHVADDGGIFNREDAPVQIGVGKNMVRAIRFWGLAAKLITEDPQHSGKRAPGYVPTRRGHALFGEGRWGSISTSPSATAAHRALRPAASPATAVRRGTTMAGVPERIQAAAMWKTRQALPTASMLSRATEQPKDRENRQ